MLDQIYEAALIPERWEGVLTRLSAQFQTNGGLLFRIAPHGVTWIGCGMSAVGMDGLLENGLMDRNPRFLGLVRSPGGGFVTDLDFLTPEQIEAYPIYKYLEGCGVGSAGAATLIRGAADDALVMSLEGFSDHAAARASIRVLDQLRPHLCRAAMLASQLWVQRAATVVQSLELIGVPAGVVSETGVLVATNDLFSRIVGTVLQDRRSRLCLADARADALLARALGSAEPRSIPLPESEHNLATILHLIPIRGTGRDLFSRGSTLVVVNDASAAPGLQLDLLRGLFDLTMAESRVAQALGEGASPKDISIRANISVDTVRTHVRSILAKTGRHRTAELVRLLNSLSRSVPVVTSR